MVDIIEKIKLQCPEILDTKPEKPGYVCFKNTLMAVELLDKHTRLNQSSKIAVHCDVDVDGIASGVILHREFTGLGCLNRVGFTINKTREHGIKAQHSNWAREQGVSLLIVVDSSSNNLAEIKTMPCDVIVLDHHIIEHNELTGDTAGGKYVIVSNMADGSIEEENAVRTRLGLWDEPSNGLKKPGEYVVDFKQTTDMSGCEVCYEFCRLFERLIGNEHCYVEDSKAYQWVGVSLWTDSISTATPRNQWYIEHTIDDAETEVALAQIIRSLSKYQKSLDKSFVQFTMAPTINCAIRAGNSLEALGTVLNSPSTISDLRKYRSKQMEALEEAEHVTEEHDSYVLLDITNSEKADSGFCGIISTKLVDRLNKNACTYIVLSNGMCKGSFRGRLSTVNYKQQFDVIMPGCYAQGHEAAFGFEVPLEGLRRAMESMPSLEQTTNTALELTAGHMPDELRGTQHIDDMRAFMLAGKLMGLGIANSRLCNKEEHCIIVPISDVKETTRPGSRIRTYDILGMVCKSFDALRTEYIQIYPEYTDELTVYARNIQMGSKIGGANNENRA